MQGQCSAPDQLNSNLKLQCPEGYAIGMMGSWGGAVRGTQFSRNLGVSSESPSCVTNTWALSILEKNSRMVLFMFVVGGVWLIFGSPWWCSGLSLDSVIRGHPWWYLFGSRSNHDQLPCKASTFALCYLSRPLRNNKMKETIIWIPGKKFRAWMLALTW